MFIVKYRSGDVTQRRFHVRDIALAKALVWAGKQLGLRILLQTPDHQLFGN